MSFPLHHIGSRLRAARAARALSQAELAAKAGISRTTLIQIEKGQDAHVSSYESVARVLGLTLRIEEDAPDMALRRQARMDNQIKLAASREKHLIIATLMALGGAPAHTLKAQAEQMVARWKDLDLCSPVYIERWTDILNGEPAQVAQNLLAMDDEWGPALRQNTPFALGAA